MLTTIAPILFTIFAWWISTGAVLWLINRPRPHHGLLANASTAVAALALIGVTLIRDETSLVFVYLGFLLGLASWGWHEVLLFTGLVSGPRKTDCPQEISGRRRFWVAFETIRHHELGIAVHAVVLTVLSLGADNMMAAYTFYVLWLMRVSAKLLVFFGAPNIPDHFLPDHLRYLGSYFSKRSNRLAAFLAVTTTSSITLGLAFLAQGGNASEFTYTVLIILTTLAALAVFEHVALVIRVPDQALWSWALPSPRQQPTSRISSGSSRS